MRARITERVGGRGESRTLAAALNGDPAADDATVAAAVLMPLIDRPDGITVLFTRRSDNLSDHAGQISFPGGRVEAGDHDATDTALRETEEEIGLPRRRIEVVGELDICVTGTGFSVVPVVGFISPPLDLGRDLVLDRHEVAAAFEVPLDFLLDPRNHQRRRAIARGRRREFYVLAWEEHTIWGATARMLVNLHEVLRDEP